MASVFAISVFIGFCLVSHAWDRYFYTSLTFDEAIGFITYTNLIA